MSIFEKKYMKNWAVANGYTPKEIARCFEIVEDLSDLMSRNDTLHYYLSVREKIFCQKYFSDKGKYFTFIEIEEVQNSPKKLYNITKK